MIFLLPAPPIWCDQLRINTEPKTGRQCGLQSSIRTFAKDIVIATIVEQEKDEVV